MSPKGPAFPFCNEKAGKLLWAPTNLANQGGCRDHKAPVPNRGFLGTRSPVVGYTIKKFFLHSVNTICVSEHYNFLKPGLDITC